MPILRFCALFALLLATASIGCRTEPADAAGGQNSVGAPPRTTYATSAKALHDEVAGAMVSPPISLTIVSDDTGRITTDWVSFPGAVVGPVPSMGRHWQERTRYIITITPAWDDPANKCTMEVAEETQQRPHDKWEWGSQDPVNRPQRAAELQKKIDASLAQSAVQPMGQSTGQPAGPTTR